MRLENKVKKEGRGKQTAEMGAEARGLVKSGVKGREKGGNLKRKRWKGK